MSKDKHDEVEQVRKPKERFFKKHKVQEQVSADSSYATQESNSICAEELNEQLGTEDTLPVSDESLLIAHFVEKPDVHGVECSQEIAEVFRRFATAGVCEPVIADCAISADYLVRTPENSQQSKVEVTIA